MKYFHQFEEHSTKLRVCREGQFTKMSDDMWPSTPLHKLQCDRRDATWKSLMHSSISIAEFEVKWVRCSMFIAICLNWTPKSPSVSRWGLAWRPRTPLARRWGERADVSSNLTCSKRSKWWFSNVFDIQGRKSFGTSKSITFHRRACWINNARIFSEREEKTLSTVVVGHTILSYIQQKISRQL